MDCQPLILPFDELAKLDLGEEANFLDPILPLGGIALVHGKANVGKSHFVLTLTKAIVEGRPFLEDFHVRVRDARVCHVQADMALRPFRDRIVRAGLCHPGLLAVHFGTTFDIMEVAARRRLSDWVGKVREFSPHLMVVDSIRMTTWQDEDDNSVPPRYYGAWRQLFPNTTLVFIHHNRKSPTPGPGRKRWEDNPEDSARGAGAWMDGVDLGINLVKESPDSPLTVLQWSKIRNAQYPPRYLLKLNPEKLLWEKLGTA